MRDLHKKPHLTAKTPQKTTFNHADYIKKE